MLAAGASSGVCGAFVGNPGDLIKTRQMNGSPGGVFAVGRACISHEGGLVGLFRIGLAPSALRAAVITAAQLGSYDFIKRDLKRRRILEEGVLLHIISACAAGFFATAASSPFDNVKTLVYLQVPAIGQSSTVVAVMMKLIRERGLFRGFFPSLSRVGIHSLVTLNTMELLRRHFHFAPF